MSPEEVKEVPKLIPEISFDIICGDENRGQPPIFDFGMKTGDSHLFLIFNFLLLLPRCQNKIRSRPFVD